MKLRSDTCLMLTVLCLILKLKAYILFLSTAFIKSWTLAPNRYFHPNITFSKYKYKCMHNYLLEVCEFRVKFWLGANYLLSITSSKNGRAIIKRTMILFFALINFLRSIALMYDYDMFLCNIWRMIFRSGPILLGHNLTWYGFSILKLIWQVLLLNAKLKSPNSSGRSVSGSILAYKQVLPNLLLGTLKKSIFEFNLF